MCGAGALRERAAASLRFPHFSVILAVDLAWTGGIT
jgi:hypothetical protein